MIDVQPPSADAPSLNSYNVAQLQFALQDSKDAQIDPLSFDVRVLDPLPGEASPAVLSVSTLDAEIDYYSRRMSSSGASDSSFQSRPDKRAPSPSDSPSPKRPRPSVDPTVWSSANSPSPQPHEAASTLSSPRVQLPSIASAFQDRHEPRRASLPTLYPESNRLRLPQPSHRPTQSASGFSSYQFPPPEEDKSSRPRLDIGGGLYNGEYSLSGSTLSSSPSFTFPSQSPYKSPSSGLDDHWASGGIVRPNSTPSHIAGALSPGIKYEESLRHSSLSGPASSQQQQQQQLFGGVTRIAGQYHHSDRLNSARNTISSMPSIKTESDWNFPSSEYPMSASSTNSSGLASGSSAAPSMSIGSSPTRSPQAPPSSLVERQPRKRGKLPKPVTDFLKDWLHRHSDHPYPSEEEKKQLCHATGLSMSQVSNWMINARRRILAPAHRAAAGPTTTTPFSSRSGPVIDNTRRASVPNDTLQLYYPMTLQPFDHPMSSSTRHMVTMTRSLSSSHASAGSLSATANHHPYDSYAGGNRLPYNQTLHPHAQSSGSHSSGGAGGTGFLSVPMSAPAISNPNPFMGSQPHQQQSLYSNSTPSTTSHNSPYMHSPTHSASSTGASASGGGGGRVLTPHDEHDYQSSRGYSFHDAHSVSPQPGSGFGTPQ